jgi:hypothetical protein
MKRIYQKSKPLPTDRLTSSMTLKQCVMALATKTICLKVSDALKSSHSTEWIKEMNIETNSLFHEFGCLVPEEIDYTKDYDCIHATVDLKIKYIDESTIDKIKVRICGCGNELVQSGTYMNETYSPTVSYLMHSTMLQLAIYDKMYICSIDTVGAFLHPEYPASLKPLYIILPASVARACNLDPKTT